MQIIRKIIIRKPDMEIAYQVGSEYVVGYTAQRDKVKKKLSAIVFENGYFTLFVQSDEESQLWKEIPRNEYVSTEFDID